MVRIKYTLHTTAGEVDVEAQDVKGLRSELERRLSDGEFEEESVKKRWMAVSTDGKYLVGRVDLRDKRGHALEKLGERRGEPYQPGTPPYVIHTTEGDVETAAWSVHEFRIELARRLDVGGIPKFSQAPNLGRSRTVTQGGQRVGLIDWGTGEFTPTDKVEVVAYWVRNEDTVRFPLEAKDLAALRDELAALTRSGAFLHAAQRGCSVDITGSLGEVERRLVVSGLDYREEAIPAPFEVHRPRSTVAGELHWQRPFWCTAKEAGELRAELGTLLHDGEFQIEEDCRIRWLPVTQDDCLVGYVDPTERRFVPEDKRKTRYRVHDVPMTADTIERLRSEVKERWDDLRHFVEAGFGGQVEALGEGRSIGRVVNDGRLLLRGTDEDGPDGTSCKSCWYWRFREEVPVGDGDTGRVETISSKGQCRRWSPHPRHGWPVTGSNSWCGEYRSKSGAS